VNAARRKESVLSMIRLARPTAFLLPLLAMLLSTGCASSKPTIRPPVTLRVMTYNIHHGEGLDGKVDLLRIAELIRDEGADLVALQEVDRGVVRTAKRDLPAELAALTGMTCVFSNNFHYQGGEYGNAILSRFPVRRWTNTHYRMLIPNEQRGLLQATVEIGGRELVFLNTHIDYRPDDKERWANLDEIERVATGYADRPLILCGDFNSVPTSRVVGRLVDKFDDSWTMVGEGEGPTIPAGKPTKRIDYVWTAKGGPLRPLRAWVPRSEASDHLPVVVEFRLE
jgi:endonuclease/exonuclease/phosphatase family metal-dependent hydrolase